MQMLTDRAIVPSKTRRFHCPFGKAVSARALGLPVDLAIARGLARYVGMAILILCATLSTVAFAQQGGQACFNYGLTPLHEMRMCAPIETWSAPVYGSFAFPGIWNQPPLPGSGAPGDPKGFSSETEALQAVIAVSPRLLECGSSPVKVGEQWEYAIAGGSGPIITFPIPTNSWGIENLSNLYRLSIDNTGPPQRCTPIYQPTLSLIWRMRGAICPTGFYLGNYRPEPGGVSPSSLQLQAPDVCWRGIPKDLRNLGSCPSPFAMAGNPVNLGTGNKFHEDVDFQDPKRGLLSLTRSYNSQSFDNIGLGKGWRHTFQRSIFAPDVSLNAWALARRADGKTVSFRRQANGTYLGTTPDITEKLTQLTDSGGNTAGWVVTNTNDDIESYDSSGKLVGITFKGGMALTLTYSGAFLSRVQDAFGRYLEFFYDASGRIASFKNPAGQQYLYTYSTSGPVASVTYPDGSAKQYFYNEPQFTALTDQPFAMTGIVDQNGTRFATYTYDATGRVVSSEHAGGANRIALAFNANGTTTATDALGTARTFSFGDVLGIIKVGAATQPCAACGGNVPKLASYDANGNLKGLTDFRNNTTTWVYDLARNLETSKTDAAGTTATQWHPVFRLPAVITETVAAGNRVTTFVYDANGNQTQKTVTGPRNDGTGTTVTRVFRWTYDTYGQVLTATDPNNNVTSYTYYPLTDPTPAKRGNLATITNPLGHVTTFASYDANGRLLATTDPNGVSTTLAYDALGHITSRNVGGEITAYTYDGVGQLTLVTTPDGSTLAYTYDQAHRLTRVQDGLGNMIVYTLDAMGNRTREDVFDFGGVLARTRGRTFDSLNRLATEIGAVGQTTTYSYDANGNVTSVADPLGHVTSSSYDALNRLTQLLDPNNKSTAYSYDAGRNLAQVTDARGNITNNTHDALGNQIKLSCPDTGISQNTFDAAGNLLTKVDARGVSSTYIFDSLNRATQVSHGKSGTPTETYAYPYDAGSNAKGRMTQLVDTVATTAWGYNSKGRVASKTQTIGSIARAVQYTYNVAGQLATMVTPSGQQIGYSYLNNRIAGVTINGAPLASTILSTPFGPIGAWQWANGLYTFRYFDTDGRLASWQFRNGSALLRNDLSFDAASRINSIEDPIAPTRSGSFQYDVVDRLTVAQQGNPVAHTTQYTYDALGNRLAYNLDGGAVALSYPATSNKLQAMTGPINPGYMGGASTLDFTYSNANRLTGVQSIGIPLATYGVSGLGQRVMKSVGGTTTLFVYDEQGKLLGEYDSAGALLQETVWLDNLPVATLRPTGPGNPTPIAIYYVHSDHLGSPRAVTRPSDNAILWRWDNVDAFGNNATNENPSGIGVFKYALRFPGQYFDAEVGTHYNYFRDFDPAIGRYTQSDPIGINGGINTYVYVKGNPLALIDPDGLKAQICCRLLDSFLAGTAGRQRHCYFVVDGISYGLYPGPGSGGGTVGIPRVGDSRDAGGDCADCKPKPCSAPEQCIKDATATYPIGGYSFTGTNSNTFAGDLARLCCAGGVPSGLGSAPGINDRIPKPR